VGEDSSGIVISQCGITVGGGGCWEGVRFEQE